MINEGKKQYNERQIRIEKSIYCAHNTITEDQTTKPNNQGRSEPLMYGVGEWGAVEKFPNSLRNIFQTKFFTIFASRRLK